MCSFTLSLQVSIWGDPPRFFLRGKNLRFYTAPTDIFPSGTLILDTYLWRCQPAFWSIQSYSPGCATAQERATSHWDASHHFRLSFSLNHLQALVYLSPDLHRVASCMIIILVIFPSERILRLTATIDLTGY